MAIPASSARANSPAVTSSKVRVFSDNASRTEAADGSAGALVFGGLLAAFEAGVAAADADAVSGGGGGLALLLLALLAAAAAGLLLFVVCCSMSAFALASASANRDAAT